VWSAGASDDQERALSIDGVVARSGCTGQGSPAPCDRARLMGDDDDSCFALDATLVASPSVVLSSVVSSMGSMGVTR